MECPKCGRVVEPGAFICPGCEFILDTSFLGDDITDDDRDRRVLKSLPAGGGRTRSGEFGEDAIILGDGQGDYSDFSSRDAGGMTREVTQARFYIGGATAALLHPDAVPEITPGVVEGSLRMSPFERHVVGFINGKRSIGRIQKKSAMEDAEFKVAVSMLADKGIIRLRTTKKRKPKPGEPGQKLEKIDSRSESSRVRPAPPPDSAGAERTVVAHIDLPPPDELQPKRAEVRGSRTSRAEATIIKSPDASRKQSLPGFASMRAQQRVEAAVDDEAEVVAEARADAWGDNDAPHNISNVFARAVPGSKSGSGTSKRPSLVDEARPEPPPPPDDEERARGFDDDGDVEPVGAGDEAADEQRNDEELLPPGGDDEFRFDSGAARRDRSTGQHKPVSSADVRPLSEADGLDADELLPDPTGIGDLVPVRPGAVSDGAPAREEAADEPADELVEAGADDGFDDDAAAPEVETEGKRRPATLPALDAESQQPTGPLPEERGDDGFDDDDGFDEPGGFDEPDGDDEEEQGPAAEDEGFDVDLQTLARPGLSSAQTASLPARPSVPELPSDALEPLPSSPALVTGAIPDRIAPPARTQPPVAPPLAPQAKAQVVGLPGQGLPSLAKPAAPPPLPGQGLVRPPPTGAQSPPAPHRPPTAVGGLAPRPSAQSKVPFEQARKAEKIFEQALKDHAEGRLSSARMNAKLAVMYDPSVETYADFLKELDARGADAKPPGGGKSRELQLFEKASEAEGKGDYDKAVELLEEAVSVNPKAAALRNRLGVVLSIRLKRHVEALDQLKVAIDLEPGNIVYMNNFSKVTALLDSQLEKDPQERKKKSKMNEKVEIKKIRPKMF